MFCSGNFFQSNRISFCSLKCAHVYKSSSTHFQIPSCCCCLTKVLDHRNKLKENINFHNEQEKYRGPSVWCIDEQMRNLPETNLHFPHTSSINLSKAIVGSSNLAFACSLSTTSVSNSSTTLPISSSSSSTTPANGHVTFSSSDTSVTPSSGSTRTNSTRNAQPKNIRGKSTALDEQIRLRILDETANPPDGAGVQGPEWTRRRRCSRARSVVRDSLPEVEESCFTTHAEVHRTHHPDERPSKRSKTRTESLLGPPGRRQSTHRSETNEPSSSFKNPSPEAVSSGSQPCVEPLEMWIPQYLLPIWNQLQRLFVAEANLKLVLLCSRIMHKSHESDGAETRGMMRPFTSVREPSQQSVVHHSFRHTVETQGKEFSSDKPQRRENKNNKWFHSQMNDAEKQLDELKQQKEKLFDTMEELVDDMEGRETPESEWVQIATSTLTQDQDVSVCPGRQFRIPDDLLRIWNDALNVLVHEQNLIFNHHHCGILLRCGAQFPLNAKRPHNGFDLMQEVRRIEDTLTGVATIRKSLHKKMRDTILRG